MEIIWKDTKRTFLGLPLSFTKYSLGPDRLIVRTGALNIREDEIRLYRVLDVTLTRSFGQRLLGLGTIHLCTSDSTAKEVEIKNIRHSRDVRELFSEHVESERLRNRIYGRENIGNSFEDVDHDGIPDYMDDDVQIPDRH